MRPKAAGGIMKINARPTIFEKGHLSSMLQKLRNKQQCNKLENSSLTRIASILGHLDAKYDIYELLFENDNQELKVDNVLVNTKDLAAFVLMDHTYTRGYFAKQAGRTAMTDTTNCQGVPLAFEGSRRLNNKKYMSWLNGIDLSKLESAWKVDVFLPAHLGSITIGESGLELLKTYGLIRFMHNEFDFPLDVIQEIREHVPTWQTNQSPKMVKIDKEIMHEEFITWAERYNNCAFRLRCLILRGWVWDEKCRNSSMITNLLDWDNYPKALMFDGLQPKAAVGQDPLLNFAGIKL